MRGGVAMIKTEFYEVRSDGVELVRTYSDIGKMIEREGILYSEAIDPNDLHRKYTETEIDILISEEIDL